VIASVYSKQGRVGGVALFIGAMVVAFVVIGYLIFVIDKALGRIANRK